jgi:hypothetical protein
VTGQKPKSEFDAQMHLLEAEIRRLETEYNMFFSGRLRRPPFETQNRVAALVKKHDQSFIRNTGDRFRFESIQNRYQKFLELVERQMTNRELGRPVLGAKRPEPPPPRPEQQTAKSQDQEPAAAAPRPSGVDDRVAALYEQLSAAKQQAGEAPVALERVAALVKAQVDKFKAQGQDVAFKVAVKGGKVQLTAVAKKDE